MMWRNDQVSRQETKIICEYAKKSLVFDGDFVEMGCYKGDTSMLLAEVLRLSDKKLWIYDSFEGLPKKSVADNSALGVDFREGELFVTKREVKERFLRAGIKVPIIKKAWFNDLVDEDLPTKIAFAFLDGDFYESIRDSLRLIEKKIVKGSTVIVHDYNNDFLPGVMKAVNEWLINKTAETKIMHSMIVIRIL